MERIEHLERALAEARERQAAADKVLEVIGRSTFELEPSGCATLTPA